MQVLAIVTTVLAIGCSVEAPPPPRPPAEQAAAVARQDAASIRPDTTQRSIADALPMGDVLLPDTRTQAGVYALLFEIRYHGTAEAGNVVKNEALPMPTLTGSAANWLKEFADVPVALWRAAHRPFPTKARPFDVALR